MILIIKTTGLAKSAMKTSFVTFPDSFVRLFAKSSDRFVGSGPFPSKENNKIEGRKKIFFENFVQNFLEKFSTKIFFIELFLESERFLEG